MEACTQPGEGGTDAGGMDPPSAGGEEGVRPLQYAWNLHGSTVDRSKSYEDNQRLVGACDTVESFWRVWRAMAKPSQLFRTAAQLDAVRGALPVAPRPAYFAVAPTLQTADPPPRPAPPHPAPVVPARDRAAGHTAGDGRGAVHLQARNQAAVGG